MRIVLGEGYPYPVYTTQDAPTQPDTYGVQIFDAQGARVSLDLALMRQCQKYRVRVVLEIQEADGRYGQEKSL